MHFRKLILPAAVVICTATPNFAANLNIAEAHSVSVSASTQINIEINAAPEFRPHHRRPPERYTGVIVDCRGLDLQRAMSPVIKNEFGDIVYGDKNLDCDLIAEIGMASYATDIHATNRAGFHPLILRARRLANFNSNPVLSNADANRLLDANEISGFLQECNVVFWID